MIVNRLFHFNNILAELIFLIYLSGFNDNLIRVKNSIKKELGYLDQLMRRFKNKNFRVFRDLKIKIIILNIDHNNTGAAQCP